MEEFKADNIGISVIYELSGLSAEYQERACELYQENNGLTISDAKALKRQEEDAQQIPGQMEFGKPEGKPEGQQAWQEGREAVQEAQEAVQEGQEGREEEEAEEETTQEAEEAQEAVQEGQEAPEKEEAGENTKEPEKTQEKPQESQGKVVYVERQQEKVHGCAFCHPHHHREISTAEGNVLLAYDPESHMIQIISKVTGDVESIVFHCCPMCGRKLE